MEVSRSRGSRLVIDDAAEYLRSVPLEERLPRYEPNALPEPTADFTEKHKRLALRLGDPKLRGGAPE